MKSIYSILILIIVLSLVMVTSSQKVDALKGWSCSVYYTEPAGTYVQDCCEAEWDDDGNIIDIGECTISLCDDDTGCNEGVTYIDLADSPIKKGLAEGKTLPLIINELGEKVPQEDDDVSDKKVPPIPENLLKNPDTGKSAAPEQDIE